MESLPDWISGLPLGWQWAIAILLLLSAIGISIIGIIRWFMRWRVFRNLWPSMEDWTAICLPPKNDEPNKGAPELDANLPIRYPGQRWCQMRNMEVGDYYQVDMQKNRNISRMCLICREGRYPKEYRIEVAKEGDINGFEDLGIHNGPIDYYFPKPHKFRVVKFTIVEPDIPLEGQKKSWCVYELRFWEARLLLRWPTWRIKARS